MDVLVEAIPYAVCVATGILGALLTVRWRKRLPRVDVALEGVGITDHEHIYDRLINDGHGWKCKCGAKSGKK